MPPKAAEKKPSTGGKAPAGKAPADKKEAGKKTAAAPSGEKKKRGKTRKETYSSYIYKGMFSHWRVAPSSKLLKRGLIPSSIHHDNADASYSSFEASSPRYRYLQPGHVYPQLICQRYVNVNHISIYCIN
jgi:hypothetical protein